MKLNPERQKRKNREDNRVRCPISELSPQFVAIYTQAHAAEQHGLDLICGSGYRKALEFLIKDFAKRMRPSDAHEIENKFLGPCINDYIEHPKIRAMSRLAAWLGNDECHYVRRWDAKDVQDLKTLIDLTIHWIDVQILTDQLERDMLDVRPHGIAN